MITSEDLKLSYRSKKLLIQNRLTEFEDLNKSADDKRIFQELVFCILTAGTSASMGINVIGEIKDVIHTGNRLEIKKKLKGIYRFYNIRTEYIFNTREFLISSYSFKIRELLDSFNNNTDRRDFFALNKNIKGIGFKEASHFLRNIGYKGYTILDKHIVNSLFELKVINENKLPTNRKKYLEIENKFKTYAQKNNFNIDELDLLIWSEKTGKILK
ncbi:MAG: N-glycosylase/DNA lyase [Thermodesulfobacteriota bacterium]